MSLCQGLDFESEGAPAHRYTGVTKWDCGISRYSRFKFARLSRT